MLSIQANISKGQSCSTRLFPAPTRPAKKRTWRFNEHMHILGSLFCEHASMFTVRNTGSSLQHTKKRKRREKGVNGWSALWLICTIHRHLRVGCQVVCLDFGYRQGTIIEEETVWLHLRMASIDCFFNYWMVLYSTIHGMSSVVCIFNAISFVAVVVVVFSPFCPHFLILLLSEVILTLI